MAEWIYEDGIGEARAVLVHKDRIIEAYIEREGDGVKAGSIVSGRMMCVWTMAKKYCLNRSHPN